MNYHISILTIFGSIIDIHYPHLLYVFSGTSILYVDFKESPFGYMYLGLIDVNLRLPISPSTRLVYTSIGIVFKFSPY